MARIRRARPPKHILVPDTSILWHQDKSTFVVSPEFEQFWEQNASKYDIELSIPHTVHGELLYQHTSSALGALERANNQFDNMSSIASARYRHRVTQSRLQKDVESKINMWVARIGANIIDLPVNDIDWMAVAEAAIWRKPPFLEEKDREKDFRDALILETLIHYSLNNASTEIAFVSADGPLREAAEKRLENQAGVTCFQSVEEFLSELRLRDEALTNEFVTAIRRRAQRKFFSPGDPKSLYYRESVIQKIKEKFSEEFSVPNINYLSTLAAGLRGAAGNWTAHTGEKRWIWNAIFDRLEGERDFYWQNRVTVIQLFKYEGASGGTLLTRSYQSGQINLRKLEFSISWRAIVGTDGRFRTIALEDIKLLEKSFEPPTSQDIEEFELTLDEDDT